MDFLKIDQDLDLDISRGKAAKEADSQGKKLRDRGQQDREVQDGKVQGLGSFDFAVTLRGKGGHGARPDMCCNPIDCFAAVCLAMGSIKNRCVDPKERLTYTIWKVDGGKASNVIPNEVTFEGTCDWNSLENTGVVFSRELEKLVTATAKAYGCQAVFRNSQAPVRSLGQ